MDDKKKRRRAPDSAGPNLETEWVIGANRSGCSAENVIKPRSRPYPGYKEGRIKFLSDAHVEAALEAMGRKFADVSTETKQKLKDEINLALQYTIALRASHAKGTPYLMEQRLRSVQNACKKALSAVKGCELDLAIEAETSHPDGRAHQLAADLAAVERIKHWAKAAEARAQKRKGVEVRSEHFRWLMILMLSHVYQRVLDQPTPATDGGPWCLFLAVVLDRCEGKPLSARRAYELWREVRNSLVPRDVPEWSGQNEDGLYRFPSGSRGRVSPKK